MLNLHTPIPAPFVPAMPPARSPRVVANRGSVVERAVAIFKTAAAFQRALEQVSGMKFSRSQVFYWRTRGQFPAHVVEYVNAITKIPYPDLLQRRTVPNPKGAARRGAKK